MEANHQNGQFIQGLRGESARAGIPNAYPNSETVMYRSIFGWIAPRQSGGFICRGVKGVVGSYNGSR
jgi:hypothetical protein